MQPGQFLSISAISCSSEVGWHFFDLFIGGHSHGPKTFQLFWEKKDTRFLPTTIWSKRKAESVLYRIDRNL
jgi:hypothetical protein